jgi:polyadenylate-binding protein
MESKINTIPKIKMPPQFGMSAMPVQARLPA